MTLTNARVTIMRLQQTARTMGLPRATLCRLDDALTSIGEIEAEYGRRYEAAESKRRAQKAAAS